MNPQKKQSRVHKAGEREVLSIVVRLPEGMPGRLRGYSEIEGRSLANFVARILEAEDERRRGRKS